MASSGGISAVSTAYTASICQPPGSQISPVYSEFEIHKEHLFGMGSATEEESKGSSMLAFGISHHIRGGRRISGFCTSDI